MRPVDSSAFCGPMNTGACRYVMPRSRQRAVRASAPAVDVVE